MPSTNQAPKLIGSLDRDARVALHSMISRCYENSTFYRDRFHASGINREDILRDDPIVTLQRLPLLESGHLTDLSLEVVEMTNGIVDAETSSGTTGQRKIRYISYEDDLREHEFLGELFRVTGISETDRVACVDTDPVNLMVSIAKAFDLLGVTEAYCISVGTEFTRMVQTIKCLEPSILVSVPSIIQQYISAVHDSFKSTDYFPFSKVIYIGEAMQNSTRQHLARSGIEAYGYYGSSETSALGIECAAHDGIHIIQERNIIELLPLNDNSNIGEAIVTTLNQFGHPLLRYRLGDHIQPITGKCSCGVPDPKIKVIGKPHELISILGSKISYHSLKTAIYSCDEQSGLLQVVISRTSKEMLELVLPDTMETSRKKIKESVVSAEPDLNFLLDTGFVDLSITFVKPSHFNSERKFRRIIDHRI